MYLYTKTQNLTTCPVGIRTHYLLSVLEASHCDSGACFGILILTH
jgi:hypothetical protein